MMGDSLKKKPKQAKLDDMFRVGNSQQAKSLEAVVTGSKNMEIDTQTSANQRKSIPQESEVRNAFDDNIVTETLTSTEKNLPSTSAGMKTNSLDSITPTATFRPDIGQIVNSQGISLGDQETMGLIDRKKPLTGFTFPSKKYVDKRKIDGFCQRYCQQQWFELFDFISYSEKRKPDGFCQRYCQQQWFELFDFIGYS